MMLQTVQTCDYSINKSGWCRCSWCSLYGWTIFIQSQACKDYTKKGYAFGYEFNVAGNLYGRAKYGTALSYSHKLYYYSNPRIKHPTLGVPLGHENANDMARKITEDRFSLNRGDESRACYTCNAYSGQRLHTTCRCATGEIDHNFQEAVIYKMNKNFLLPISLLVCATLYSYNVRNKI